MRLKLWLPILFIATLLVFSGCASIMHGSKQEITFTSNPSGATVEVFSDVSEGRCDTPCSLILRRNQNYRVVFKKGGYQDFEAPLRKGTDGWIWGNILFGGVIGLVIDLTNGSAYKLRPGELEATLSATTLGDLPELKEGERVGILDFDQLSPQEKEKVSHLEKVSLR
jgi:uncharacterized protein YceK